jgi:hypothetical protein
MKIKKTSIIGIILMISLLIPNTAKAEENKYIYDDNGKILTYKGSTKDIDIMMNALEDNLGEELYFKSDIEEPTIKQKLFLNMSQELLKYKYSFELFNIKENLYMIRCSTKEAVEANKEIDKKITKIYKELKLNNKTDIEKITAIHDYVVTNYKYEFINYSMSEIIDSKKAKCDGYAALFQLLAEKSGIKSLVVTGFDKDRDILHTFNLVMINKKWYQVDCTYDASQYKKSKNYRVFLLIKKLSDYELGEKYQELKLATKSYYSK